MSGDFAVAIAEPLAELNAVLERVAQHKRGRMGRYLFAKGQQLVLGNQDPRFGPTFKGLYDSFAERAPQEGEITRDRLAAIAGAPEGSLPVRISPRAYARADALLGGDPSGVFTVRRNPYSGKLDSINRVRVFTRGKRKGKRALSRRAKTASNLESSRSQLRPGEVILNRPALAATLELHYRESSRKYLAAAFLRRRYRTRGGIKTRQLVRNKGGDVLGLVEMADAPDGAAFRLQTFLEGHDTPMGAGIVARVVGHVANDMRVYAERKEAQALEKDLAREIRGMRKAALR